MGSKALRRAGIGVALLGLVAAAFLLLLLPPAAQAQQLCKEVDVPHPLEMNTVEAARLFKTVAMEKEVFHCSVSSDLPSQVVDLETFIEIIEKPGRDAVTVVEKRVEVTRCIKNPFDGTIRCEARNIPLRPVGQLPIRNCSPGRQLADPVVMNTVASKFGLVKTIKLDKEVFNCGDVIGDLYLFTEIIEAPRETAAGLATLTPVAKRFEAVFCLKRPQEAQIIECFEIKL